VNLGDVPHIQNALKDVLPIVPDLWRAVEEGTAQARTTLDSLHELYLGVPDESLSLVDESRTRRYDPWFFSHTVRFISRLFLSNRGLDVALEIDEIPNSGLRVRYEGRVIRIRKATSDGGVPPLGDSAAMQGVVQLILSEEFACTSPELLLLWHASKNGIFEGLSAVFALPGRHTSSKSLGTVWLPNPAESDIFHDVIAERELDLDIEILGDLPIEPLTAEEDDDAEQRDDAEQA